MRILIAEDDTSSRELLVKVLNKFGHEVIAANDGLEAWTEVQKPDAPRLVILDWMMPRMDGVEVCRKIREIKTDKAFYIIILTVLDNKERVVEGLDAGANDYLIKPAHIAEIRARVDVGARVLAMQESLAEQNRELREALAQIKTLRGIIPICGHCKRIREDENYWRMVEEYVSEHTEAMFSHGICPECRIKHFPVKEES